MQAKVKYQGSFEQCCDQLMNMEDIETLIEEKQDDYIIEVSKNVLFIPELKLYLRSGVCSYRYDENGDYEPDFGLTAIYDCEGVGNKYLYFEQDSPAVSLYNFLSGTNVQKSCEDITDMDCEILEITEDSTIIQEENILKLA